MNRPRPRWERDTRQTVEWRRRYASYALPPVADGVADPLDRLRQSEHPSTYSLTPTELWHHAADLARCGWTEAELRRRFKLPAVPAA